MYSDIRQKATAAVKWAVAGQWAARALQPLVLLILARVLSPGEYGLLEVIVLLLVLARLLQEFGLGRALVQTPADPLLAANTIFWISLPLSISVYMMLILGAPGIAAFFGEPQAANVLRVAGLQLPILGLGIVPLALAQRALQFRLQTVAQIGGAIAMAIVTVALLIVGWRLWAYVVGLLVGAAIQVGLLWQRTSWRPSLQGDKTLRPSLLRFGFLAALEAFQGWLLNYGDNMIVGYFLGVGALGFYALAYNMSVMSVGLLMDPLTSISFSSFSRLQSDRGAAARAFLNLFRMSATLIFPVAAGLALVAEPLAQTVLAGRWMGITPLIQLLALSLGASYVLVIIPEMYKALGRPDIMPRFLFIYLAFCVPTYLVGVQFGLLGFTVVRVSLGLLFLPAHVLLASRLLRLPLSHFWGCVRTPLFAVSIMAIVTFALVRTFGIYDGWLGWLKLAAVITGGAATYFLAIYLLDRDLVRSAVGLVRQAVRPTLAG